MAHNVKAPVLPGIATHEGNILNNQDMIYGNADQQASRDIVFQDNQSKNTFVLKNIIRVLLRRRYWILVTIGACMIAAIVIISMSVRTYEATVTIELNKNGSSVDLGLNDSLGQQLGGTSDLQTDLQTETAILQDEQLALAVIKQLGLESQEPYVSKQATDPEAGIPLELAPSRRTRLVGIFRSHLRVVPTRGTRLIQVTVESHNPVQAAQIANALIDSYKSQYLQSHFDATNEASEWLTKQLSELKANVADSEKKLTDFEKESGILGIQGAGDGMGGGGFRSVVIQKLDALNSELTAAEGARIQKEAIYRLVSNGSEKTILELSQDPMAMESKSVVLSEGAGLAPLQQLVEQRDHLKILIAQASVTYGQNNRHLLDLQTQLQAVDEQMREQIQEIAKRANGDYLLAKQTEAMVRSRYEQQEAEATRLNEKAVEYAVLSQEATSRKKLYEDLYTKLQEANVSAGIKATNITVINPARPESSPIRPKRANDLGLGLLIGIFGGLGIAFLVDSLDSTVVSPLEVEEICSVPVIGVIPLFAEAGKGYGYGYGVTRPTKSAKRKGTEKGAQDDTAPNQLWILMHPESAAAEALRSLRTSIMLSRQNGGPHVVLVTSCVPGEGKSTISANLAASFAQHGKRVIIIEADMRRPAMKHVLEVSNAVGLSNVLAGSVSLEDALQRDICVPGLDVLSAGPRPPLPSEMLGSRAFDQLLAKISASYDQIIIDSPPALLLTDAVAMASKTDAVVWVAQAGVVTRPQLARASQMIKRNAVPIIGFVLNKVDWNADPYGYGYGYGYNYSTYAYKEKEETSDGN